VEGVDGEVLEGGGVVDGGFFGLEFGSGDVCGVEGGEGENGVNVGLGVGVAWLVVSSRALASVMILSRRILVNCC